MRTSGQSGRADAADQFSLPHARAAANRDRGKMQVLGFEAVRVAQMHHPSCAAVRSGFDHEAVCHGDHRRARRRFVIDAQMRAVFTKNRMQPAARES